MSVNQIQKHILVEKMKNYFGGNMKDKKIALWGIAFKPNTDDIREAPSLYIIDDLINAGCKIVAYDPEAAANASRLFGSQIEIADDMYQMLKGADALAILTEWAEFRTPDFEKIASLMNSKIIFDGRNLYSLDLLRESGFYYNSIGRQVLTN